MQKLFEETNSFCIVEHEAKQVIFQYLYKNISQHEGEIKEVINEILLRNL